MRLVVVAAVLLAVLAGPAVAATPTAREYSSGMTGVPTGNSASGIAPGPDGNLWFTENNGKIGRLPPWGSVAISEFDSLIGQPNGITPGPDGNLWTTQGSSTDTPQEIGRMTPAGTADDFDVGTGAFGNLGGITAGPDGNLWFAVPGSRVGRMNTSGASPTLFETGINGIPIDIAAGADGNLWFIELENGLGHKIAKITTGGGVTEFAIDGEPRGIAAGPDDKLWFTLSPSQPLDPGRIGRIDPNATNPADTITYFTDGITGDPTGIIAGPDGNLWFTESGASRIGRITPSGSVTEFSAGITSGSGPKGITAGPDGNLWFTETAGRIGRINTALDPMRFTDRARIVVPAAGSPNQLGVSDPYPAQIEVSGLEGTVTEVSARLNGLHHGRSTDAQALLVGPQGQKVLLFSDSTNSNRGPADGQVLTLDDDGVTTPSMAVSGFFKPIVWADEPTFAPDAPGGPYATALSAFDGTNPNGTWKLYVEDVGNQDTGVIAGGWSLDIETTGPPPVEVQGPPVQVQVPGPTTTVTGPGQTVTVPEPPDTTRPGLRVSGPATRVTQAVFRKGPKVTVTPTEPVTLHVTLSVAPKGVTVAAVDDLVLYERTLGATRATAITARPSAKYLGRPKKPFRAVLRIVASDRAGNRAVVSRTITVNPDRRKRPRR